MNRLLIILITVLTFSCKPESDLPITLELHDNWEFKQVDKESWHPATVPGEVHSYLFKNKLINNPFIGNNEFDLQWISETDWEYKTTFSIDKKTLDKKHIKLNFEGLDTYASVYLNDSLILKSNNAFRQYKTDVKALLKNENTLRVVFENTSTYEEQEKAKLGYTLPEGNRIFTRKAQFQYGWDWGPKMNTSGIWRPVTLYAWNDYRIENIHIIQNGIIDSIGNITVRVDETNLNKSSL